LRKALEGSPTPELRRQATRLLEKLTELSAERLRQLRAIEGLEPAAPARALAGAAGSDDHEPHVVIWMKLPRIAWPPRNPAAPVPRRPMRQTWA